MVYSSTTGGADARALDAPSSNTQIASAFVTARKYSGPGARHAPRSAMSRIVVVALGCALAAGCAYEYVYRPAENATATVRGQVAARYQIPTNNPQGDVRVASFGVAK